MTISDERERARTERDRRTVMDPDRWPHWPKLPLKARDLSRYGCLLDGLGQYPGGPFVVVLDGMLANSSKGHIIYSDIDQLLAEWRVD